MSRTVYIDGEWLPEAEATVSIFDRGFLFADSVYEVTAIIRGKMLDFEHHAARLQRSLAMLDIPMPVTEAELLDLHRQIATRNAVRDGLVYLQISRGKQDRSFLFDNRLIPTFVMFTQPRDMAPEAKWGRGIALRSFPEGRWKERQIKTTQLLYASMAKTNASREGFDDVVFVEDGLVTECSSANFHIVDSDNRLVTRGLSNALLPGVTRSSIIDVALSAGITVQERAFSLEEASRASEAFITDSINIVMPVVSIDRLAIGLGRPGPITRRLRDFYLEDRLSNGINVVAGADGGQIRAAAHVRGDERMQ